MVAHEHAGLVTQDILNVTSTGPWSGLGEGDLSSVLAELA